MRVKLIPATIASIVAPVLISSAAGAEALGRKRDSASPAKGDAERLRRPSRADIHSHLTRGFGCIAASTPGFAVSRFQRWVFRFSLRSMLFRALSLLEVYSRLARAGANFVYPFEIGNWPGQNFAGFNI
jgi:hypothetical protein